MFINLSKLTRGILYFLIIFSITSTAIVAQQSTSGPIKPANIDDGLLEPNKAQVIINSVPAYIWKHGCGPTSVGMIVGYWDGNGFPNLVEGSATTQTADVNDMIASDHGSAVCNSAYLDHYRDFSCPRDDGSPDVIQDLSELGGYHELNCVADFMQTSWSSESNKYGWSWYSDGPPSFIDYIDFIAPEYEGTAQNYAFYTYSWEQYKAQIDAGKPVMLLVDTDGNGGTDHFIVGYAYDDVAMKYGCRNTWDGNIHWYDWRIISSGSPWGIYGITTFDITHRLDSDGDGIVDVLDNCPDIPNPGQDDGDEDGVGDICDNCENYYNPNQDIPEYSVPLGTEFSEKAVAIEVIYDTTWVSNGSVTLTATASNPMRTTTLYADQVISWSLRMNAGCNAFDVAISQNGSTVAILTCDGTLQEESGSFQAYSGDVIRAHCGIYKSDGGREPDPFASFTYHDMDPTDAHVGGYVYAGTVNSLTNYTVQSINATVNTPQESATVNASQTVNYSMFMPSEGICEGDDYAKVKRGSTTISSLYCDVNSQSDDGSFFVNAGEIITAQVSGIYVPSPPSREENLNAQIVYYDYVPGDGDFHLMFTDACGGLDGSFTYGSPYNDIATDACMASDNGFLVVGYTSTVGNNDFYMVKFDEDGTFEWDKTLNYSSDDKAFSVIPDGDDFVILGTSDASGTSDLRLTKVDGSDGTQLWTNTYGQGGVNDLAGEVIEISGGFAMAGSRENNPSDVDIILIKTNTAGIETGTYVLGSDTYNEYGYGIVMNSSGNYYICGKTDEGDAIEALVMSVSSIGLEVTHGVFGNLGDDVAYSIALDFEEKPIFAGYSTSYGDGSRDALVGKCDTDCDLIWLTTYGGSMADEFYDIKYTVDNNYIVAGFTDSEGAGWSDFYAARFILQPPVDPVLTAPINGKNYCSSGSPTFTWNNIFGVWNYRIQIDNNSDFSSPIHDEIVSSESFYAGSFGISYYYWRVRAENFTNHWGDWSDSFWFRVKSCNPTSCPVLFTYNENDFVMEDVLLTECEVSNYQDVVTDYYMLKTDPTIINGLAKFQLRELEDEVTYLQDIELIMVEHDGSTNVSCSRDGNIITYNDVNSPLKAIDHNGVDRTAEIASEDDLMFESSEPGFLIIDLPYSQDLDNGIIISSVPKPICEIRKEENALKKNPDDLEIADELSHSNNLIMEILQEDGSNQKLSNLPLRLTIDDEIVMLNSSDNEKDGIVTIKISWEKSYKTNHIGHIINENSTYTKTNIKPEGSTLQKSNSAAKNNVIFNESDILKLNNGDVLDLAFEVGIETAEQTQRTFIVKATGRYQPEYMIESLIPNEFKLNNNYPNPFNPTTVISYDLPTKAKVKLEVYNVLGQHIKTLIDEEQTAGQYEVVWDSNNQNGSRVASGVYFYRLKADSFIQSKKMILLK